MSTLTVWHRPVRYPFAEVDALVRHAFGPGFTRSQRPAAFAPAAEITRDGEDALVRVELPGLDVAKDVAVELDRGRLVIRGERRDERTDAATGRSEVRYGSFRRSFSLPASVTAEAISAGYDAGVLSVRVAGAYAGSEPRQIAVSTEKAPAVEQAEQTEPTEQADQSEQGEQSA